MVLARDNWATGRALRGTSSAWAKRYVQPRWWPGKSRNLVRRLDYPERTTALMFMTGVGDNDG